MEASLRPGLLPVLGRVDVAEGHQVSMLMATLPHAAHQRACPRTVFDGVNRATATPVWLLGQLEFVEVVIVFRPVIDLPYMKWLRSHSSSAFCCECPSWMIGTIAIQL